MVDVLVHDTRVQGHAPDNDGGVTMRVGQDVSLALLIAGLQNLNRICSGIGTLSVFCHGIERRGHGLGFGLELCSEDLTVDNVHVFGTVRGMIQWIDLYACGAAHIAPGYENVNGDGNLLCTRLASLTGARVRASTAAQRYSNEGYCFLRRCLDTDIDFGAWEGTVLVYTPSGKVAIDRENSH